MLKPDRQSPSNLRLVASSDRPLLARAKLPAPAVTLVIDERPRRQLLRTMTLVAAARRFAAVRLRRKLAAGRIATLWLAAVTAWSIMAQSAGSAATLSGMLSIVGMLLLFRPRNDERLISAAAALDRCAADIKSLADELVRAGARDGVDVHELRGRYGASLRSCEATHLYADYMAARCSIDGAAPTSQARLQYAVGTYAFEIGVALLPAIALCTF